VPVGRQRDELHTRGRQIYLEDQRYVDDGRPGSSAKQAAELSNKVGLPVGWSDRFMIGARSNGNAFAALAEDGLAYFAKWAEQLMAERISCSNQTLGITPTLGPGPQSLDAISLTQIQPAVDSWAEENFYNPPEIYKSPVGFFQSERRVREQDLSRHKERVLDWKQEKLDFSTRLVDGVREQAARSM